MRHLFRFAMATVCLWASAFPADARDEMKSPQLRDVRFFASKGGDGLKVEIESSVPMNGAYAWSCHETAREGNLDFQGFRAEERAYALTGALVSGAKVIMDSEGARMVFALEEGVGLKTATIEDDGKRLVLVFERGECRDLGVAPGPEAVDGDPMLRHFLPQEGKGEYYLGAGDRIDIVVYQHQDISMSVTVPLNGELSYPLLGPLRLAGRTVEDVRNEIRERLGRDFIVNPQVSVNVGQYESQWVFVGGQVRAPGKITLKGPTTITDAIAGAGGILQPVDRASATWLAVSRKTGEETLTLRVPIAELYHSPVSPYRSILLAPGDFVEVLPPDEPYVYVSGEVKSPGPYLYEEHLTVYRLILKAGGLGDWGNPRGVELIRVEDGQHKKYSLNLNKIREGSRQDMSLRPADLVVVKRRLL